MQILCRYNFMLSPSCEGCFLSDPFLFWGQSLKSCVECCGSMWIIVALCDPWFVFVRLPWFVPRPRAHHCSNCSRCVLRQGGMHQRVLTWKLFGCGICSQRNMWYDILYRDNDIEYIHVYTVHTHIYIAYTVKVWLWECRTSPVSP